MAPLRVWGPQDRLEAPDLNANFGLVAEGRMPGALCPAGQAVNLPANVATDLAIPEPAEGSDQGGYWQAGELLIPRGLGGWHRLSVGVAGLTGAPKGDALRVSIDGFGVPGLLFRVVASNVAGVEAGRILTLDHAPAEGTSISVTVAADSATTARLFLVRIVRLASFGLFK